MDRLKKFMRDKKVDRHFNKSGPGVKLSTSSSGAPAQQPATQPVRGEGTPGNRLAAEAALKREQQLAQPVDSSRKKIQLMAARELANDGKAVESGADACLLDDLKNLKYEQPEIREVEHSSAIGCVKYTCELLGDSVALPRDELMKALEEFLVAQSDGDDDIVPAAIMIASLNKGPLRALCQETIKAYLTNILNNPGEPKYRKIRLSNKVFKEKVDVAKGGYMFMKAVGFEHKQENNADGCVESFLVMAEPSEQRDVVLVQALQLLDTAPMTVRVARDTQVFMVGSGPSASADESDEFFTRTIQEIREDQHKLTVNADRMTTLRTQKMRNDDRLTALNKYNCTMIRLRTPDGFFVQGVFGAGEPLSAVRNWLAPLLASPFTLFTLCKNASHFKDESASLTSLGLVPAALLHTTSDSTTDAEFLSAETKAMAQ